MAFTERFVTNAAGGGGVGTEGDPWTLAEALTQAIATDRVNVQSDSAYSLGVDTVTNAGTALDLIVFRGYNSTIGDLENPGRSSTTGKLDTTGFPAITLTGSLTPNAFVVFQNLAFTGVLSTYLLFSTVIDNFTILECEIINTQNNSLAGAVKSDNEWKLIGSDFECTGAAHAIVLDLDVRPMVVGCRIKSIANDGLFILGAGAVVVGNTFIGNGVGSAISIASKNQLQLFYGNTLYNWATAFEFGNITPSTTSVLVNNHATDCAKYIDDLHVATDLTPIIEMNERTRDNTTPRTGVGDGVNSGEVTTDTGGKETDYTDADNDDLSLIAAAPGIDTGLGFG